jgi:UDP-N-acetylmuramoyl-L-alanyl-D-glutamate--2,6-diaminopimelate ligase
MTPFLKNKLHFLRAVLAVFYFRYPARKIKVIGVTGTDGKTTTSTLIYHLLLAAGKKVTLVSTVSAYVGKRKIDTGLHVTSPNPWFLQKLIKEIVDKGYDYLVLEATSHGLDQHRLLGANISIAVLTNITHEHLDYHKTYTKYLNAKAIMFKNADVAILNKKDASCRHIKKLLKSRTRIVSYSDKSLKKDIKNIVGKKFAENYNRLNATASILATRELGIDNSAIKKGIKNFSGIPGRMEEIKNNKGIKIFIDFAHTPNALKNVLKVLRKQINKNSKLIVVFGCAGERDIKKRPLMGRIATELADISVFTAEDPRYENVNVIIESMVKGAIKTKAGEIKYNSDSLASYKKHIFIRIPDRREAIKYALQKAAKRGDIVAICGKGHEKSLAFGDKEIPWSDQKVARQFLQK